MAKWLLLATMTLASSSTSNQAWPLWELFKLHNVSADGRVIDRSSPDERTTSEGQAYALFFALVANDENSFDKILRWTEANIANASLKTNLPAWLWGRKPDGTYGVLDRNSASDADLWMAFALDEAGRLWHKPHYTERAEALYEMILRHETISSDRFGRLLLPAPYGFQESKTLWRLNPSYAPLFIFRHREKNHSQWKAMRKGAESLVQAGTASGHAVDWIGFDAETGFVIDPIYSDIGSYNAIRVYLWLGLEPDTNEARDSLIAKLKPWINLFTIPPHLPPESVFAAKGSASGRGPLGFSAALLPFFTKAKERDALSAQLDRLKTNPLSSIPDAYYTQVLGLFGTGSFEGRFEIDADFNLKPQWVIR